MQSAAPSSGPRSDEPLYLSVIDLFARVAPSYFAIVGVALVVDLVRGDGLTFRSWSSFAIQSGAAFVVATIVARWVLARWRLANHSFVPANISASAAIIGLVLAAGTLAGGFFPDTLGYQRRAPEPFWRGMTALVPMAIAVYLVLRSANPGKQHVLDKDSSPDKRSSPGHPQESPLTGEARDAAVRALEMLDRGEQAVAEFERVASGTTLRSADADRLWTQLDGKAYVTLLRQMPNEHAITKALRQGAVAQTDAVYLIALAQGAHDAMGQTAEGAQAFIAEVAARRGRPGADAGTLRDLARRESMELRDTAAGLLHASRFSSPAASA